jgi:type II secretory pathway pseudopilin PulG
MRIRNTIWRHSGIRAQAGRSRMRVRGGQRAFTIIEGLVVTFLSMLLVIAGLGAVMLFDKLTRRMALQEAAVVIAEGQLEQLRGVKYTNTGVFTSSSYYQTNLVTFSLNDQGTTYSVTGRVVNYFQPVTAGHLITSSVDYTQINQRVSVSLQTLMNNFTGGQQ